MRGTCYGYQRDNGSDQPQRRRMRHAMMIRGRELQTQKD